MVRWEGTDGVEAPVADGVVGSESRTLGIDSIRSRSGVFDKLSGILIYDRANPSNEQTVPEQVR
jgi:hypothetical protein